MSMMPCWVSYCLYFAIPYKVESNIFWTSILSSIPGIDKLRKMTKVPLTVLLKSMFIWGMTPDVWAYERRKLNGYNVALKEVGDSTI